MSVNKVTGKSVLTTINVDVNIETATCIKLGLTVLLPVTMIILLKKAING